MPRNPDKTRCAVPGCRNWAMRGADRCRSHRDRELGPRGGGAPPGNLNALLHGRHAHPLPSRDLQALAGRLQSSPEQFPAQLAQVGQALHRKTRDPYKTLVALRALHQALVPRAAADWFDAELEALLQPLPLPLRDRVQAVLQEHLGRLPPERRLATLRRVRRLLRRRARTAE
jgi:hypothetical protein